MANYNKVLLMGNLTRDPQLRYLPNQTPVVDFGLAVNRRWKGPQGEDREEVTFVDCAAFGRQAETINQYCQKGRAIFIEGRLKYDTWEDKQGGGKRSKLSVVVETFQFIGGREGAPGSAADSQGAPRVVGRQAAPGPAQAPEPLSNDSQFKEDDIPF